MNDPDIVASLRNIPRGIGGFYFSITQRAADEIERLRSERDNVRYEINLLMQKCRELQERIDALKHEVEAKEKINSTLTSSFDALRRERDEARRRVCEMSLQLGEIYRRVGGKTVEVTTAEGVADMMKWDCYNHEYKRRQRALDEVARISEQLGVDSPPKPKDFLQDRG